MMSYPVWCVAICPICHRDVLIGLMSLAATCVCGAYYVDIEIDRGWYVSQQAYERGGARIE
jgi:hypothetical protein